MQWLASAAFGLEGLVKRDLQRLGVEGIRPLPTGGVEFEGDLEMGFRANLWLRTADRVQLVLKRFEARSFEELYQGVKGIKWTEYLGRDAKFPIKAQCARSTLMSPRDCQAIAKKAVVEALRPAYQTEWLNETGAVHEIDISIHADQVTVALNSSGESLSRRGYRTWNAEAPLRETLAAAILLISPFRPSMPFLDPLCGSGTLLIEAAFIALDRAPGLLRAFDMEKWDFQDAGGYIRAREEAQSRFASGMERELRVSGSDIDPEVLELARRHIGQAGLEGRISIQKMDVRDVPADAGRGHIVTNPPYGDRLGDKKAARAVAEQLGKLILRRPGWTLSAITSDVNFERAYGRRAKSRRRLYNGRIECELLTYQASDGQGKWGTKP